MTSESGLVENKDAGKPGPFSKLVDAEWQALLDKDDRTSPAEYPDMCLITRLELSWAMAEAWFGRDAARPTERQPEPREATSHKEHEPSLRVDREVIAKTLYEIEPWHESGEFVEGFQVSPGGALSWEQAKRLRDEFSGSVDFAGPWSVVEDAYASAEAVVAALLSLRPEPVGE